MSRIPRLPKVLLLIETSRAYGRGLVEGVVRFAEENGPWSIFFEERGLSDPLPRWFKNWRGQGIISRSTHKADLARLRKKNVPTVELFANPNLGWPSVFPNEESIARLAVEHFLDRGLRHFGYFCLKREHWSAERCAAFRKTIEQYGFSCNVYPGSPRSAASEKISSPTNQRSVIRWLRALPKPCGILCSADIFAMQLLEACRTSGIVVPEQVAVLGVDNDPVFCGVSYPKLSSIDAGASRIGYEAAALLARMMAGVKCRPGGVSVEPIQVVARESTDNLAMDDADMARAARLIREQACHRLLVSDVAAAVALSRRALEQRFQRALHRSPKEEILRVRLERAKMLLTTSSMSVSQVARKCGFSSHEYFARLFQRRIGTTPCGYRKTHRLPSVNTFQEDV